MYKYIILIYFCLWSGTGIASAQPAGDIAPVNGQWQSTLDVVKTRLNALLDQNNQLTAQYQSLQAQEQDLLRMIAEQNKKNEDLKKFVQGRHGKTDQQIRIEELGDQIKARQVLLGPRQREANALRKKAGKWHKPSAPKVDREAAIEAALAAQTVHPDDPELDDLRKDLEAQKVQDPMPLDLSADIVQLDARNRQMREKVNNLRGGIALLKDKIGILDKKVNFRKKGESNGKNE